MSHCFQHLLVWLPKLATCCSRKSCDSSKTQKLHSSSFRRSTASFKIIEPEFIVIINLPCYFSVSDCFTPWSKVWTCMIWSFSLLIFCHVILGIYFGTSSSEISWFSKGRLPWSNSSKKVCVFQKWSKHLSELPTKQLNKVFNLIHLFWISFYVSDFL